MSDLRSNTFIILGKTKTGQRFRPSDWAERLCGVLAVFGAEKKMKYSPYVGLGHWEDEKAVFVDAHLAEIEPTAHRFLLNFAKDNDLVLIDGICPIPDKR